MNESRWSSNNAYLSRRTSALALLILGVLGALPALAPARTAYVASSGQNEVTPITLATGSGTPGS